EDQERKFKKFFGNAVGVRYMGREDSPYLIHPISLTTVDTLSLVSIGLSPEDTKNVYQGLYGTNYGSLGHYMFSWSSIFTSSVVLDEVHLLYDSVKSLSYLYALQKISQNFGMRVIMLSATLPSSFTIPGVKQLSFRQEDDEDFFKKRAKKEYPITMLELDRAEVLQQLAKIVEERKGKKILVYFNTVSDAVHFYKMLGEESKVLVHSRFSKEDREKKIEEIFKKRVIITTQALEAGVDISSEVLITELAPANSIIQRAGRFLRFEEMKGEVFIFKTEDTLNTGVYDYELMERTWSFLQNHSSLNLHVGYKELLDYVYTEQPEIDTKFVDKIISIITDLTRPTESAMKFLLKNEGSLIRDGNIFNVVVDGVEFPANFNLMEKYCGKVQCQEGKEEYCPRSEEEAIIMGLKGCKFILTGNYSHELGFEGE
ncbi:CRISPR-associated helicase Cas3', partial [Acidianus sp. RZ1]|uniref:CRISPR-associated helicase Cas3' n=1 Tax=Acidianus sp. RZ1 TaxID=1540082 RepID=UPI001492C7C8